MRTNLPRILARQRANRQNNGTCITLNWTVTTGGTVDPVTQSIVGGTVSPRSQLTKGFVHTVQIATSQVKQFNEYENGDLILDFDPALVIDGLENLTFTLPDGTVWTAKQVGDRPGHTWDAMAQGQPIYRSVLVRKAT